MATRLKERLAVLIALKEATDNEGASSRCYFGKL
jgi:hypothetical protein